MINLKDKCIYLRVGGRGEIPGVLCSATGLTIEVNKDQQPIRLAMCPLLEQTVEGCKVKPLNPNSPQQVIKP